MGDDQFDEFFRKMMKRFFKDFEDIEKEFGRPRDLARRPRGWIIKTPDDQVNGGGFSISIKSDGKEPPRIDVKRFGPSGKWERVPLARRELLLTGEQAEKKPKTRMPIKEDSIPNLGERAIPEYKVSIGADEVTIAMNAEGVEDPRDVRLRFYPESVEVYASARKLDRQYFCTVALPSTIDRQNPKVKVEKGKVIIDIPRKIKMT